MALGLRWSLLLAASAFVVLYVVVALSRIGYPFELEWLEGGSLQHVERILAGQAIYASPSWRFVPFAYTPLYFYASALVASVLGASFPALRLVSLLSSLGVIGLVFAMAWRETRDAAAGVVAAGLFAATYPLAGTWLDIARPDSLFLFLLLLGSYGILFHPSPAGTALVGLAFGLSFLTKQTAIVIVAPILLYLLVVDRRRGLVLLATLAAVVAISTAALHLATGGWYSYYAFRVRRGIVLNTLAWNRLITFWSRDLALPLGIACFTGLSYFFLQSRDPQPRDRRMLGVLCAALIGGAWLSRMEEYGFGNVNLPAYAAVALLFGIGAHSWLTGRTRVREPRWQALLALGFLFQFGALIYQPRDLIPTRADARAGEKLVECLRSVPGKVLIPLHPYLGVRAGKPWHAHAMGIADVTRADSDHQGKLLADEVARALEGKEYAAVLLDDDWLREEVERSYRFTGRAFADPRVFATVAGNRIRPEFVYVPKNSLADSLAGAGLVGIR